MRAYLIDPYQQKIDVVEYNGDWRSIKTWIDADTFDATRINTLHDTAFVDDFGLLRSNPATFSLGAKTLAGTTLVLGVNEEGMEVEPKEDVESLRERIVWHQNQAASGKWH